MNAKLFMTFCLVIICAFFTGCLLCATEEQEIIQDMNTSREGTLSNGRRFVFYGADQVSGTFEELLEERGLSYFRTFNFIVQEETVEEMLARPEIYDRFTLVHIAPHQAEIFVYYFAECGVVVFDAVVDRNYFIPLGPLSVVVVNRESGTVSRYNEGWSH
ncbi:MAG: hypothetical protein FWC70_06930 [Defluviitaleaceae bacterium]|nr:hypothetical protein [Defluviitaleaceae bacterium]